MVPRINFDTVNSLARRHPEHGISVIMPAHPEGQECRQDPIRLRNLVDEAAEQLRAEGVHDPEGCVATLRPFQEDMIFWEKNRARGLCIYINGETHETVALPAEPEEALATVAPVFHVLPLLPAANRNADFYLLAFGQDDIRFFHCDRNTLTPIDLPEAPEDFAEILGQYAQEEQLQHHTGATATTGKGRPQDIFHGQGVATDETDRKKKLTEYCQRLDDAVCSRMGATTAPLLLAATEPLGGIYRALTAVPHLDPHTLKGNPQRISDKELHAEAVALLEGHFDSDRNQHIDNYGTAKGQNLTEKDFNTVLSATHHGQIDTLFVREGEHCWGEWSDEGEPTLHESRAAQSQDLLNLAAVYVLRHGGMVFAVSDQELPDAAPLAAILRYPTT